MPRNIDLVVDQSCDDLFDHPHNQEEHILRNKRII